MAAMVPREDLVNSAVAFLQDPSVANSPLDKRRAFLESKNLTAEEIQLALARAGEDPNQPQPQYNYPPQQRSLPSQGYGYYQGGYPGQWPPPPAMEPPRRDWRDWFIMATVTTGVGYGLYSLAKRYVAPIIAPPTPPQLEQDKAAIDAEFNKAFALIDQLSSDTTELKNAEEARNRRLDSAIGEIEAVLADLKQANADREKQARRTNDDIAALRERIPAALQGWKAEHERRLGEVGQELRSLKMLVGNRVGVQAGGGNVARAALAGGAGAGVGGVMAAGGALGGAASSKTASIASDAGLDIEPIASAPPVPQTADAALPSFRGPDGKAGFSFEGSSASSESGGRSKRAIPAWQLAASGGGSDDKE